MGFSVAKEMFGDVSHAQYVGIFHHLKEAHYSLRKRIKVEK